MSMDTAKLREALEVVHRLSNNEMVTRDSVRRSSATLRDFIERGLPFLEASMAHGDSWDGYKMTAGTLVPFLEAYRAMQQAEKVVIPCNCNEYEGSGVDVLNCPVHGGKK